MKRDQQAGIVHIDLVNPKKNKEYGTITAVASNDENIFFIRDDNHLNFAFSVCTWIVDTRASFHVTPREELFSSYQRGNFGTLNMGNHITSKIVSIGKVSLITENGNKLVLNEVRHVPEMHLNLISVGKLDDLGMINQFGSGR